VSEPRFSVVIPAYNAAATIAGTLGSVFAQSETDFELIVVDDGSADETPDLIRGFTGDRRLRLIEQENQGTAGARNTGIEAAQGRYVSFLDNDDFYMPRYLERIGAALDSAPEAGFAYADGWLVDEPSRRVHRLTALQILGAPEPPPQTANGFLLSLVERVFIRSATTMRRSVLDEVGGFDSEVSGVDDFDLWARILQAGHGAVQAPGMLLVYRDRPDSLSKDAGRMADAVATVTGRIAEGPRVSPEVRAAALERKAYAERMSAAISGSSRARAALLRVRLPLGRAYRALTAPRRFLGAPPAELVEALGDPAEF
jgi:glycosyltransferase involved in cell wall biosynthesis